MRSHYCSRNVWGIKCLDWLKNPFFFLQAVINNVFSVLLLPGLASKNHIACHKSVQKHLLVGELDLKSRKSFGGRAKQTRGLIGRTPVQANPAVPPSHPICGPWHKGADEQPLSANAILGLSSVACMVAAKRGLMASSFKGAPHQTLPPLEFLSSPTLYATFIALHLDNILSFALSGQIAATTKRWYEQRCWKVDIAIKKISLFL